MTSKLDKNMPEKADNRMNDTFTISVLISIAIRRSV